MPLPAAEKINGVMVVTVLMSERAPRAGEFETSVFPLDRDGWPVNRYLARQYTKTPKAAAIAHEQHKQHADDGYPDYD